MADLLQQGSLALSLLIDTNNNTDNRASLGQEHGRPGDEGVKHVGGLGEGRLIILVLNRPHEQRVRQLVSRRPIPMCMYECVCVCVCVCVYIYIHIT